MPSGNAVRALRPVSVVVLFDVVAVRGFHNLWLYGHVSSDTYYTSVATYSWRSDSPGRGLLGGLGSGSGACDKCWVVGVDVSGLNVDQALRVS
jgi:hypothetical protein